MPKIVITGSMLLTMKEKIMVHFGIRCMLLIIILFVTYLGSLYAGDAFWYWENCVTSVTHHFLYEGLTFHITCVLYCV